MDTKFGPKPVQFESKSRKALEDIVRNGGYHTYHEVPHTWYWGAPNNVVMVTEGLDDFCIKIDSNLESPGLIEALKTSQSVTSGDFLQDYYAKDKVLSLFSDDEWVNFAHPVDDSHRVYRRENRIFVRSKSAVREVFTVHQCMVLGVPSLVTSIVQGVGRQMEWPAGRLELNQSQWSGVEERGRLFEIRNTAGAQPNVIPKRKVRKWRSTVTWNTLVEYPYSFDLMLHHANFLGKNPTIGLGYMALRTASNINRQSNGRSNEFHQFNITETLLYRFQEWMLGCAAAGRFANKYAQFAPYLRGIPRSLATKISETLTKIRLLNLKIVKHVMGFSIRLERWNHVCNLSQEEMFNELDSKWQAKVKNNASSTMRALSTYLKMFSSAQPFRLQPKAIVELLQDINLEPKLNTSTIYNLKRQENSFLGKNKIEEIREGMQSHYSYSLSRSEIIESQEKIVGLKLYCEGLVESFNANQPLSLT